MNKLIVLFLAFISFPHRIFSQYWQQEVNYNISVSLNDKERSLQGFEKIQYINHSPDTLRYIWFHLWPNAYKTDKTAFSDQLLQNGNTDFYFSSPEEKGYINRLDFRVDNISARVEDHPLHIDIIKLLLPTPLLPGKQVTITTPFHVKLPFNVSRGGYDGETFQVTQWYPKPAVYDKNGWHPMTYLDQGEFYSEFGRFEVSITVPSNYVVAATGELMDEQEKKWLDSRSTFSWKPVKRRIKRGGTTKTVVQLYPASSKELKTIRFKQDNVHDFAWFADKRFIVNHDTCKLGSGRVIDVYTYYTPAEKDTWSKAVAYAKDAVVSRSNWIGEYPYSIVSVVQGPQSFGGGMEYPTITVISPEKNEKLLDYTIAHEIGHNWFYGILGNNERNYPWMDEGLNTYYDNRYSNWKYGDKGEIDLGRGSVSIKALERIGFETLAAKQKDQPINTHSERFSEANYGLVAYYKTGAWLEYIESVMGTSSFDRAMQAYFEQWKFKHPQPEDLRKTLQAHSDKNLDSAFSWLDKTGVLPNQQRSGNKTIFLFDIKGYARYIRKPSRNALLIGPSAGINSYDKLMLGAFVTNLKLPPSKLQFFAAPMYAFGSKQFNGIGFINYNFYPRSIFKKVDIGFSASRFSMDRYEDTLGNKLFMSFQKFVPRVRFTFANNNPRSTSLKYIQFKSYLIGEDRFRLRNDSSFAGTDTIVTQVPFTVRENRTLNQLLLVAENNRALYPYRAEFKAEQGKGFVRLAFTGNYFFNYNAKNEGAAIRFFAGKFLYTDESKADPFLYGLNLSAPKGYLDYTYSDYFIGRNDYPFRSTGYDWSLGYQQVMIRDGGLKVNTDAQGNTGASDDWIAAINGSFDVPASINPLSVLPFKIPFKIFVDVGTYAEPWKKGSTSDRFLYDAGFQLYFFRGLVNVYVPILYSKVFREYYKADFYANGKSRFLKTIAFSIDISNFNLRKLSPNFAD